MLKFFRLICMSLVIVFLMPFSSAFAKQVFPENIYPKDVYTKLQQVNMDMDTLLKRANIKSKHIKLSHARQMTPQYVYQVQLAVLAELQKYQQKIGLRPAPLVVSQSKTYYPADVLALTALIQRSVNNVMGHLDLSVGQSRAAGSQTTSADVFQLSLQVYTKLLALNGVKQVNPTQVYQQLNLAKRELQEMIKVYVINHNQHLSYRQRMTLLLASRGESESGKQIIWPVGNKSPRDVYNICVTIRQQLKHLMSLMKLPSSTVAKHVQQAKVMPVDVYIQSQLILSDMNLLKGLFGEQSTAQLLQPAKNKASSDVYYQAQLVQYMLTHLIDVVSRTSH